MSRNFQLESLPISREITRSARARTCDTGVVQVCVHVQVLAHVHVHVKVQVQLRGQVTHAVPQLDALYCEGATESLGDGLFRFFSVHP